MRIPEKHLARESERIANAGIRSVMTFGISHHTDETGSDAAGRWTGGAYVAHLRDRARNDRYVATPASVNTHLTVTAVFCEHGVDNDATLKI